MELVYWVLGALGVGLLLGFWIGFHQGMKSAIFRLLDSLPPEQAKKIQDLLTRLK